MLVYYMTVSIHFPNTHSLKEKRKQLRSIIKRIQNTFNVSVAESAGQDKWQLAELSFAGLAAGRGKGDRSMENILSWLDQNCDGEVQVREQIYL